MRSLERWEVKEILGTAASMQGSAWKRNCYWGSAVLARSIRHKGQIEAPECRSCCS